MAEDWVVKEYRDCVILCAAVRVVRAICGNNAVPELVPIRAELRPAVDRLFAKLQQFVQRAGGGSMDDLAPTVAPAEVVGEAVLEACQGKPLYEARLIGWWLRAGPVPATLRKVLPKPSAIGVSVKRLIPFGKKSDDASRTKGDAAAARRLKEVADAIDKLLEGSVIKWCSDNARRFALGEEQFLKPPPALRPLLNPLEESSVGGDRDPRRSLLRWCCRPERPGLNLGNPAQDPEAWFKAYRKKINEIVGVASDLLGGPCEISQNSVPTMTERDAWELFDVVGGLKTPFRVLHPPLTTKEQAADPIVRGLVVMRPISRLVAVLKQAVEQRPAPTEQPFAAVLRAIESFPPLGQNLRKLSGLSPWKKVDSEREVIPLEELHCSLLGPGRLLLAVTVANQGSGAILTEDVTGVTDALNLVSKGLQLDGFYIQADIENSPSGRLLPMVSTGDQVDSKQGVVAYRLTHRGTRQRLLLGTRFPCECRASVDVLAAVENLDWTVWFLEWARNQAQTVKMPIDNLEIAAASMGCSVLKPDRWEQVKRNLFMSGNDLEVIRQAFGFLHSVKIGLCQVERRLERLGALRDRLLIEVSRCEAAVLEEAHRLDPENVAGIFPPRRLDGSCDLKRLVREPWCHHRRVKRWRFQWQSAAVAAGETVRESRGDDDRLTVVLSAGELPERDVRLLNLPFVLCCPHPPRQEYYAPLHDFGRQVCEQLDTETGLDFGEPIRHLRRHLATELGQQQFNTLVHRAIDDGDDDALQWLERLVEDPRFDWSCHPVLKRADSGGWQTGPIEIEERLVWIDSADHPPDTTVAISYAIDADQGLRTLSRGQPAANSPEKFAGQLVDRLAAVSPAAGALAEQLQLATDRFRFFGDKVPHPVIAGLPRLLDCLVDGSDWDDETRADAYGLITAWCRAYGHVLLPETWHPRDGTPEGPSQGTEDTASDPSVRFHPTVPAGRLVVEAFGIEGQYGRALQASLSAGPPPQAYERMVAILNQIDPVGAVEAEVWDRIRAFPRRLLAGKQHLAGPALFDAVWNAVATEGPVAEHASAFKEAIEELLLDACQISTFNPSSVGEFPSDWLCDGKGNPVAGTWIKTIVRPGLRTSRNKLVWPAVVEME